MTAKVFEHPFDLTKVRLQSQVLDAQARFSGPLDCLTQTYRNEGIRGLYRVRTRCFLRDLRERLRRYSHTHRAYRLQLLVQWQKTRRSFLRIARFRA